MNIGSLSGAAQAAVAALGESKAGSVQQAAQISVLKKANDTQAQSALALISGIGTRIDTRG